MAKKGAREIVAMVCPVCKNRNFITNRNKINIEGKLLLNKYCRICQKYSQHKETVKLK